MNPYAINFWLFGTALGGVIGHCFGSDFFGIAIGVTVTSGFSLLMSLKN